MNSSTLCELGPVALAQEKVETLESGKHVRRLIIKPLGAAGLERLELQRLRDRVSRLTMSVWKMLACVMSNAA